MVRAVQPIKLSSFTMTSALGAGKAITLDALRAQRSGLVRKRWESIDFDTYIGEVAGVDAVELPAALQAFDCRNNRLALMGLTQDGFDHDVQSLVRRVGASRVGVFLGTSTSGILSSELAYRQRDSITGALPQTHDYRHTHNSYSVADFVRSYFGLTGPACVVSTACSSSAKVFGNAQRMLNHGLIDAAIVGGVDSLCLTTLYGFNSLQLLSGQPCRPFDAQRDGISIGEAAAFALVERADAMRSGDVLMTGLGESSDAHHMSSPHPEGWGARDAMLAALRMAGLHPAEIDYINLHGTATRNNDLAESRGVAAVFRHRVACSSTKGHTGHTLGAAGAIEAVMSALVLQHGFILGGAGTQDVDTELDCDYRLDNCEQPVRHVLSNSFGFGGSNCSLILSKVAI